MPNEEAPPAAVGPYTPIVRSGDWLVCSGQIGLLDDELVAPDTASQLRQAIANLTSLLRGEGAGLDDVVKTTVFLLDMDEYSHVNDVYSASFGSHRPARSAVAVAGLPRGARVEIEAWAFVPR